MVTVFFSKGHFNNVKYSYKIHVHGVVTRLSLWQRHVCTSRSS